MFTAKNNLVMARAMQHKYDLPVITMTVQRRRGGVPGAKLGRAVPFLPVHPFFPLPLPCPSSLPT